MFKIMFLVAVALLDVLTIYLLWNEDSRWLKALAVLEAVLLVATLVICWWMRDVALFLLMG